MPHRSFQLWLNERCYLVVEFTTIDGLIASFVVRLMQVTKRGDTNMARYDTAHGMAHLDILSRKGNLLEKRWLGIRHLKPPSLPPSTISKRIMKTTSTRKAIKQSVVRISKRGRAGLPKTAAGIEKWIVVMGGKPVGGATRARLVKPGHWGMPAE